MYLRELFIKNSGPLRELQLDFAFTADGLPLPHVIVGRNGAGKTNLLSLIADALMEGAANVYSDILTQAGIGRNWFRIVGGKTTTYGELGSFSILRFEHDEQQLFYNEHSGDISAEQAKAMVSSPLSGGANWSSNKNGDKTFTIKEDLVRAIYPLGAYAFFPSSRSETPFWLNRDSIFEDTYRTVERYSQTLQKPIYVEHAVDLFAQWLLGVLTESRARLNLVPNQENPSQPSLSVVQADLPGWASATNTLNTANQVLQTVIGDSHAQFYWTGRRQSRKVGILSGNEIVASGLDTLSGGQSSLLAMFGTILRYGDDTGLAAHEIPGIIVIDELDAHMHIDLQITAIPKLIAMFPRIQFIISSHSPFFALGMEKQFSDENVRIVDISTGLTLNAESYTEFDSALTSLMQTRAFEQEVRKFLLSAEQPVIWVAGETDVTYFQTAAKMLGYPELADYFQWIGSQGERGPEYSGDGNLKAALKFLRNNPGFTGRTIIAIFDNDANQSDEEVDGVHIIGLQTLEGASIEKGVENLLPEHVFTSEVFEDKEAPSGIAGKPRILPELRKRFLAERLCGEGAERETFESFKPYLDRIRAITEPTAPTGADHLAQPSAESSS